MIKLDLPATAVVFATLASTASADGLTYSRAILDYGLRGSAGAFGQDTLTEVSLSAEYRLGNILAFGGYDYQRISSLGTIVSQTLSLGAAINISPEVLVGLETKLRFPGRVDTAFAQYDTDRFGVGFSYEKNTVSDVGTAYLYGSYSVSEPLEIGFRASRRDGNGGINYIRAFADYTADHFGVSADIARNPNTDSNSYQLLGSYEVAPDWEVLGLANATVLDVASGGLSERYKYGLGLRYQVANNTSIQGTFFRTTQSSQDRDHNTLTLQVKYEFGKSDRLDRRLDNRFREIDAGFLSFFQQF